MCFSKFVNRPKEAHGLGLNFLVDLAFDGLVVDEFAHLFGGFELAFELCVVRFEGLHLFGEELDFLFVDRVEGLFGELDLLDTLLEPSNLDMRLLKLELDGLNLFGEALIFLHELVFVGGGLLVELLEASVFADEGRHLINFFLVVVQREILHLFHLCHP
jgi:hypothetical protein